MSSSSSVGSKCPYASKAITGSRTSSVKTLTDSSGVGDGSGDGRGLAGSWLEICVAARDNRAAKTSRPVVRFSQNIVGIGCLMPGAPVRCLKPPIHANEHGQTCVHLCDLWLSFPRLRLDGRDGDCVDDVAGGAAAREIVGGFVETLKNRSDGGRAGQSFRQLVSDISSLQVWKNQD